MIEEDISSFEPGVFEPTRRTLVKFEPNDTPDFSTCPPSLAPTYMSATFSVSGTVEACSGEFVDYSANGSFSWDLDPWVLDEDFEECQSFWENTGAVLEFECPEDCPGDPRNVFCAAYLAISGEQYNLVLVGDPESPICIEGDPGSISGHVLYPIGTDPIGDHHLEVDSDNGATQFVFDIHIE